MTSGSSWVGSEQLPAAAVTVATSCHLTLRCGQPETCLATRSLPEIGSVPVSEQLTTREYLLVAQSGRAVGPGKLME